MRVVSKPESKAMRIRNERKGEEEEEEERKRTVSQSACEAMTKEGSVQRLVSGCSGRSGRSRCCSSGHFQVVSRYPRTF